MKKIICSLLVLAFYGSISAQEQSHGYYNYLMNFYNVNPAYTGYSGNLEAILNVKSHMYGLEGAPRNLMFGLSSPVTENQSLGGRIIADSRGYFNFNKIDLSYAYFLKINEEHKLTFGASAGIINRKFDAASINRQYLDETDPTLVENYMNETNFVVGAGLLYQYKNFELGIASPHMVEDGSDLNGFQFINAGYIYTIKESDFQVKPMIIYQNLPVIKNKVDYLVKGIYDEKVWAQLGYQSTSNMTFGLGFDLGRFSAGYIYEMNNSELSNISSGSNQLMIKLTFAKNENKKESKQANDLSKSLDSYINTFDKMLKDESNKYSREDVLMSIQEIKKVLVELKKENNIENADEVASKLEKIEKQVQALEIKYKK